MNIQQFIPQIFTLYPFNSSSAPTLLKEGIDNNIYVFKHTNGNKAVLRVSKRDVAETIDFETKLLRHFFEHKAPVAELLPTRNGNLWEMIDRVVVVAFCFVPGTTVLIGNNAKPNARYAYSAGKALGQLHTVGLSFTCDDSKRRTIFTEYERALLHRDSIVKLEGGSEFLTAIESYLKWARQYQGDIGIIHNDFIPDNILFDKFSVSAVVDFDWSCRGPLIKDLGIALAEWSLPDGLEHHWEEILMSFLDGYNKSAPQKISPDSNLYKWICFSCLSDACTFFADLPADPHINRISQCRRYRKFIHFEKYL